MRFALLALSALGGLMAPTGSYGQTVTFSPQGASALKSLTGKVIPSVQIVGVIVCPAVGNASNISAGRLYGAAVQARFSPILPKFAVSVIQSTVARNWRQYALEAAQVLSIAAVGLTASGVIKSTAQVTVGLATGHSIADYVSDRIRAKLPDAAPLILALLDPESKLDLSDGCRSSAILSLFGKGIQNTAVRIDLADTIGQNKP